MAEGPALRVVADALLDLIAPTRCAGCERPGALLCDACRAALPLIDARTACPRCGAPERGDGAPEGGARARGCSECTRTALAFESARCAATLAGPVSRAITLYKDGGDRRLGALLGDLAGDAVADWRGWPDAVTPLPATRAAVSRRGFDHADPLAAAVADALGVPCVRLLARRRAADQRALDRDARFANAKGTFDPLEGAPVPRRVVLVDDVLTTGASVSAAADALLAGGAMAVRVVVVARAC